MAVGEAALGIPVIGREGAAVRALMAADVAVTSIEDALDLPQFPKQLVASLRMGARVSACLLG